MSMQEINVIKRDGTSEKIDMEKIHKVVTWAAEGLEDVSVSLVELRANVQFYDGITTEAIHQTLIRAASDLISEETPDYQYLAARLTIFHLRKQAFGRFTPPSLYEHIEKLCSMGIYDHEILELYTFDEITRLNMFLRHERDLDFSYAAVNQLEGKYLVQNRVTKEIYESPQFMYMLIGMCLFSEYSGDTRMAYVRKFYDAVSTFKISLPTPIMAGVRTPTKQFSSCVKIEVDDSLDSINASSAAIVKYISARAGIGINAGRIRGIGSPIRNGEAFHTGCIPFFKHFQTAVKSCSQGAVRGGAATLFYPMWHWEVESFLVLKNNRGVEENRIRHMDYGVQLNKLMYERLMTGGNITLFSPSDVPGLYDAFFEDQELFTKLYIQYENDETIRKKTVKAVELFSSMMQERASTGRIYIQNVDHSNTHSAFNPAIAPVRQSNLCITGDTRVVSSYGLLTAKELHDLDKELTLFDGHTAVKSSKMKLREKDAKVWKVGLANGMSLAATSYHGFPVLDYRGELVKVPLEKLRIGDYIPIQSYEGIFGEESNLAAAYTLGGLHTGHQIELPEKFQPNPLLSSKALNYPKNEIPGWLWRSDAMTVKYYVKGLLAHNAQSGCLQGISINLTSINKSFLLDVQILLSNLGIATKVQQTADTEFTLTSDSIFSFCETEQMYDIKIITSSTTASEIVAIEYIGTEDVYCPTINTDEHIFVAQGMLTFNCMEITLPTKPINNVLDEDGEIALCTLAAFNLGTLDNFDDLEELSDLIIRALDALLDYQDYPLPAGFKAGTKRRALGVGVINYAYALAKRGLKYSDGSGLEYTHELFEAIQYYLLKASNNLAKEKGACEYFNETTYAQGLLPIDTYKKEVDEYSNTPLRLDWEQLRTDIGLYGLRNSTVTALMPSETSSQISNATNGIEPPRGFVSIKQSKDGVLKQVVPDFKELKDNYELLWSIPNNTGYLNLVGVMQKFVDQSISANTNYNPASFPSGKVPMQQLLKDLILAYKNGVKTLYYHNTRDGSSDTQDDNCDGGGCKI